MQSYTPAQLPRAVREVEAVSWSQDQRIAVTSSDTVFIFTLKGSGSSSSSSLPVSVSTASGLPATQNPPPTHPSSDSSSLYDPSQEDFDLSLYLDHTHIPNHTPTTNWESGWSPAGCDVIGGCLLSVLTVSGQLWLLTPPGSHAMKWHISTSQSGTDNARYTTFHWLPHIIPAEDGVGGVSLIAMATKTQIRVIALKVPVHRDSEPEVLQVWEGEVESEGWPCRLRWSHTPSPDGKSHLAVGTTGGQLVILSWTLPSKWGGAIQWAEPECRVVWAKGDGMAVRHITWQLDPPQGEEPWLVFAKFSTLVAVQLPSVPSGNGLTHITIFGVHSRSVSGLASLPGNQFVSCSLDSSVQIFTLSKSHDTHVTPTPVVVKTLSRECRVQGLAVSAHGLFLTLLSSENSASVPSRQIYSHLHLSPLLPLSNLHLTSVDLSWDTGEAIRLHTVSKQPLPGKVMFSDRRSWHRFSPIIQLRLHYHSPVRGEGGGREGEISAVVMMGHVVRVLEEAGEAVDGGTDRDSSMSLNLMSQWVESNQLAPPTQEEGVLGNGMETETCHICHTSIPFTSPWRETCSNGHSWERCCVTLLLAMSSLCGRCRGCGAVSHNLLSLKTSPNGFWFGRLISKGRCTFCHSYFDLIT